ncbi:MAG: DUF2804 domain-containing protein [Anaerolineales bacterium]|nr:DUF2804 domain-containing protein [Anaerolineales bacterium]
MQTEITQTTPLLDEQGELVQVGWARHPLLECNLEKVAFYPKALRALQFARVKRWDYYAIFTPQRFFSATIADLGYAGNVFVYTLDFESNTLHEEGLVIPLGHGVTLSRQTVGVCEYGGQGVRLRFETSPQARQIAVDWPAFHDGRGIRAEISLALPLQQESMNIVIPIPGKRFYYNHKINCLPASGTLRYGEIEEQLEPGSSLGQLDWGRGVWEYSSFWNWASASGYLPDGRRVGLNLGCGFGDTSAATENALLLEGRVHKLDQVTFEYEPKDTMAPWKFRDNHGRLALDFVPFKERLATTRLLVIDSEVHQMFGRYHGNVTTDSGEQIQLDGLIGFAEEHHARW